MKGGGEWRAKRNGSKSHPHLGRGGREENKVPGWGKRLAAREKKIREKKCQKRVDPGLKTKRVFVVRSWGKSARERSVRKMS